MAPICTALGLPTSAGQRASLLRYLEMLQRWNATYNLTAVRDRAGMLTQHLADCLALMPHLQKRAGARRLLDVGSGGGLPGVVIAVLMPDLEVTCVDSVGKKAAFIRQVAGALPAPNLLASHARVQSLKGAPFDLIVSRAFATLGDFAASTRALLVAGGSWVAMKGRVPDEEIAALPAGVEVFHVEQLTVPGLAAQRCLIWMREKRLT